MGKKWVGKRGRQRWDADGSLLESQRGCVGFPLQIPTVSGENMLGWLRTCLRGPNFLLTTLGLRVDWWQNCGSNGAKMHKKAEPRWCRFSLEAKESINWLLPRSSVQLNRFPSVNVNPCECLVHRHYQKFGFLLLSCTHCKLMIKSI